MKYPDDDVSLFDGEQFNVRCDPYNAHIAQAPERQMVNTQVNIFTLSHWFSSRNCDVIIIVLKTMVICIINILIVLEKVPVPVRDMVPSFRIALWTFKKGNGMWMQLNEVYVKKIPSSYRQANTDYSICQALKCFSRHTLALVIYDICCQWCIYFCNCVSESEFLEVWESLKIIPVVRKWHLAAHIAACFHKFSLNFIEGAAQVEDEIMETLWSVLDEVASLTQGMSLTHRQEVLNDYMNDSNWCKILWIGRMFWKFCTWMWLTQRCRWHNSDKMNRATKGIRETSAAYQDLTSRLDDVWIADWTVQEQNAMEECDDALKIYMISSENGIVQLCCNH